MPSLDGESSECRSLCRYHENTAFLYCKNCADVICDDCMIDGLHSGHKFAKLTKVFEEKKEKVAEQIEQLKSSIKKQKVKEFVARSRKDIEKQIYNATHAVATHYQELLELIEKSKSQAFNLLLSEQRTMLNSMTKLEQEEEYYQNITSESTSEDIKELDEKLLEVEAFHANLKNRMCLDFSRLAALQTSVGQIVKHNKELLPRPWQFAENLTFQNPSSETFKISEDNTSMCYVPSRAQKKQQKIEPFVRASQRFTSKCHYWEVEVKGVTDWSVGIVEENRGQRNAMQQLGTDRKSWVLHYDGVSLASQHDNETIMVKQQQELDRLGVFLDCTKGLLRFYNVKTGATLHTFLAKFKAVYPAFSIGKGKARSLPMTLCELVDEDVPEPEDVPQTEDVGRIEYLDIPENRPQRGELQLSRRVKSTKSSVSSDSGLSKGSKIYARSFDGGQAHLDEFVI